MDTSARKGSSRNITRLSRSRSWPALTARPSECARLAASSVLRERKARALRTTLERPRERLGVQLDPVGTGRCRPPNGIGLGVDEQADADAKRLEPSDHPGKAIAFRSKLPAGLAGHFSWHDGNQGALVGTHLLDEIQQLRTRIAFDVEFDSRGQRPQHRRNFTDIVGRDVTPVGPGVDGDARRARRNAHANSVDDARRPPAARVPQRRDFVDVDGETNHTRC